MEVAKPVQRKKQKNKNGKYWHCREHDTFTRFNNIPSHTSGSHRNKPTPKYFECTGDDCDFCKGKYNNLSRLEFPP